MTTDELLKVLEGRALKVLLQGDGQLALGGNKAAATRNLLRVLKLPCHREEILRRLGGQPAVKSVVVVETSAAPQALDPCPKCGKTLDGKARCWALKCGWRACVHCGKDTANVFIASCWACQQRLGLQGGWADE